MLVITVFILFFIQNLFACPNKYCHICENHTLCKYKLSGPNSKCIGYEKSLLTTEDINIILDQINRRRNFIASGQSKYFPMAANMKKIVWSNELAEFAQRWVDQCDQTLQPDKEDECRDLENTKVGQSIATIKGSSPGINVKSFVEVWFMQSLNFVGSVTYYNQSLNYKTNYFTQLIWADTDEVGCGKAKFFVKNIKTTIVERLVCNFAPSGNIHGKPVYIIGYSATQCHDNMISDKIFPGLCSYNAKIDRLPSADATGLLRIRNLFNDSIEPEIDPVYYHLKQIPNDSIEGYIPSNKTFNLLDNFDDAIKRSYPLENDNFWINNRNKSRYDDVYFHQKEKGPSRAYHGHDYRNAYHYLNPDIKIQHSRRHNEFSTPPANDHNNYHYRKHGINHQCTRKKVLQEKDYLDTGCNCNLNIQKCTRGQKANYELSTEKIKQYLIKQKPNRYTNDLCDCKKLQTNYPIHCNDNRNCVCGGDNHSTSYYSRMLKVLTDADSDNLEREDFNYYDLSNLSSEPNMKSLGLNINSRPLGNHKKKNNLDYSEMKKRSASKTGANFKPFWQMDGFPKTNHPELKSIRYTTLPNKRLSKLKSPKSSLPIPVKTEIITITKSDRQVKNNRFTERYLSFDELLHLQKNQSNQKSINYNGRRHDEENNFNEKEGEKLVLRESVTKKDGSTEYTANTPFIRIKHCTRKLTCTWTAASRTDSAGSIVHGNVGSRTPPGYVDGCTRTSTCTRDFMDRNKIASLPTETTIPVTDDDEDYCERRRRSLNKRSSNTNDIFLNTHGDSFLENNVNFTNQIHSINDSETILNERIIKRDMENSDCEDESCKLSYGDLYYFVLNKIVDMCKSKNVSHASRKCSCNTIGKLNSSNLLLFIMIFSNL